MKINISEFGHYNPLAIKEFSDYLIKIFNNFNFNSSVSKNLNRNSINLVFEGHHGLFRNSVIRVLNNSNKIKKGIVITEIIYGSKFLKKKYFTFNNRILNKNLENQFLTIIYLLGLNFIYNIVNKFIKIKYWNLYQQLKIERNTFKKKIIYYFLYLSLNSFEDPNGVLYWKERYNFFIRIEKKFNFVLNISSFNKDFFKKIFDNYHNVEFMSTNNNKKYEINNKIDKEIDCIFTGQITKYRLKIFDLLKENNIKAVFLDYLEEEKRQDYYNKNKIYLFLKKNKDDNLPIGTRAWYCLENKFFFIVEKTRVVNNLNKFCIQIDSENFISEIKKILNNYKKYTKLLANNFNEYDKYSFMNDMQIKMLISYLKKNT